MADYIDNEKKRLGLCVAEDGITRLAGHRGIDDPEERVEEHLAGQLESHTVLGEVGSSLTTIPFKVNVAKNVVNIRGHSVLTLAIRCNKVLQNPGSSPGGLVMKVP